MKETIRDYVALGCSSGGTGPSSIEILTQKLDNIQSDLLAVMKNSTELVDKISKLKKQIEVIKEENHKAKELLQKLMKVR